MKTIQDAIKENKATFDFLGEHIRIVHSVGLFITMNPGYAGRTELPENLKALFRYVLNGHMKAFDCPYSDQGIGC